MDQTTPEGGLREEEGPRVWPRAEMRPGGEQRPRMRSRWMIPPRR